MLRQPKHESLRQAFEELILKVLSPDLAPIAEVFDHPEDPMTTRERLQHWYDEQKAEAVQQGLSEGLKKGRAEGQRSVLAKQLRLKFGPLDSAAEARLADATPAQLDRWTERVLTAGSLEQIWD